MPDREKVIRRLERMNEDAYVSAVFSDAIDDALALLKEQEGQTEIVRCKDCKYYDGNGTCMKNGIALLPDYWFCADGDRKTGLA